MTCSHYKLVGFTLLPVMSTGSYHEESHVVFKQRGEKNPVSIKQSHWLDHQGSSESHEWRERRRVNMSFEKNGSSLHVNKAKILVFGYFIRDK